MTNDKKNIEVLNLLSKALKKYPHHNIKMEGFANRYANNLNEKIAKDLSENRAKTVSRELSKRGINKQRMTIVGRGFDDPIIPLKKNMTKEETAEMARNRRVEFYLEK
jgi:outer membrane protein OmpA-like peptidoglycan-associated protein